MTEIFWLGSTGLKAKSATTDEITRLYKTELLYFIIANFSFLKSRISVNLRAISVSLTNFCQFDQFLSICNLCRFVISNFFCYFVNFVTFVKVAQLSSLPTLIFTLFSAQIENCSFCDYCDGLWKEIWLQVFSSPDISIEVQKSYKKVE